MMCYDAWWISWSEKDDFPCLPLTIWLWLHISSPFFYVLRKVQCCPDNSFEIDRRHMQTKPSKKTKQWNCNALFYLRQASVYYRALCCSVCFGNLWQMSKTYWLLLVPNLFHNWLTKHLRGEQRGLAILVGFVCKLLARTVTALKQTRSNTWSLFTN